MLRLIKEFFTKNVWLKMGALLLALALWFYVVNELNKGSEEDRQFLNKILPSEGLSAKKLSIKPILIGTPPRGYMADPRKAFVSPEYCIVVGTKDLLSKIRFSYTMPVDVRGMTKSFTRVIPLSPIAPGIYTEETLVQVTVSVEKQQE